jgi:hypothetical protein
MFLNQANGRRKNCANMKCIVLLKTTVGSKKGYNDSKARIEDLISACFLKGQCHDTCHVR